MSTEAVTTEFQKSVATLVKQALTLLALLIVSGIAGHLPGADVHLSNRLTLAVLLECGLTAAMMVTLALSHGTAVRVLAYVLRGVFSRPEGGVLDTATSKVARQAVQFLYVCLLYGMFMRGFGPAVRLLPHATWPLGTVRIAALAGAVIAIVRGLMAAQPLFGEAGHAVASRVVAPAAPAEQVTCPGCGVLDDGGSKFCRFCGHALAPDAPPPATDAPKPSTCTRCGAAVNPPARFCPACGKPV